MPVCVCAHDYMTCFFACYPSCLVCWVIHLSYARFFFLLFCLAFTLMMSERQKARKWLITYDFNAWTISHAGMVLIVFSLSYPVSKRTAQLCNCFRWFLLCGRLFICYVVIESLFYSNTKQLCYNECRYKSASYSFSIHLFYPSVTCSPKLMIPLSFYRMKCSLFREMNLCTHIPKPNPILCVCELCVCVFCINNWIPQCSVALPEFGSIYLRDWINLLSSRPLFVLKTRQDEHLPSEWSVVHCVHAR